MPGQRSRQTEVCLLAAGLKAELEKPRAWRGWAMIATRSQAAIRGAASSRRESRTVPEAGAACGAVPAASEVSMAIADGLDQFPRPTEISQAPACVARCQGSTDRRSCTAHDTFRDLEP